MKTIFALVLVAGLAFPAAAQESSATVGQISTGDRTLRLMIMEYKGVKHPVLSLRDPVYSTHITLDGGRLQELKALIDATILKFDDLPVSAPAQ